MSFAMSFFKILFDVFIVYKFSSFSNFLFLLMNIVHGTQMLEEFFVGLVIASFFFGYGFFFFFLLIL